MAREVFLIPPLPRRRDWFFGGVSAGVLLGCAELVVSAAVGLEVPPEVRVAVVGSSAVVVAALSMMTGAILRAFRRRPSHSEMVGAIVGTLCAAASLRPMWLWLEIGSLPPALDLVQFGVALAVSVSIGFAAAQLGQLCERKGAASSGALLWSIVALLLASAGHLVGARSSSVGETLAILACGSGAASVVCVMAFLSSRRRGLGSRTRSGRLLLAVGGIAVAVHFSPVVLPWILLDPEMTLNAEGPPNVLVIAMSRGGRDRLHGPGGLIHEAPTLGVTAWSGVTYPSLEIDEHSSNALSSALTLSDGSALPRLLKQRGYVTDQIAGSTNAFSPIDSLPFRESLSPARWLADRGRWLSTAPLLGGVVGPFLDSWGLLPAGREMSDVNREAMEWLVDWRTGSAPAPFLLFVDFRSPRADGNLGEADLALAQLLDHVEKLDGAGRNFVLLLLEGPTGQHSNVIAIARPPSDWRLPGPETRGAANVEAQDLADALAMACTDPASRARRLPGIAYTPGHEFASFLKTAHASVRAENSFGLKN
ncbi:hypothetical protein MK489_09905 [Myxococcota bacterium]|nr:hypothetical protein [Myxococcota bacterium]